MQDDRVPTDEELRVQYEVEQAARAALPRLGSWGAAGGTGDDAPPEVDYGVVTYYDKEIRVVWDPLSLELTFEEFIDEAAALEGTEDPRAVGAVRRFLRRMIHPDDFTLFWSLVRLHRQDIRRQMEFGKWLMGEVAGYPTEPQSGSPAGLWDREANSGADVSLRAQARLEAEGRPDLALVVVARREHVAASTG